MNAKKTKSPIPLVVTAVLVITVIAVIVAASRRAPRPPSGDSQPTAPPPRETAAPVPHVNSVVLSPSVFALPGDTPTPWLVYANTNAGTVTVAGSWGQWSTQTPLDQRDEGRFVLDVASLNLDLGRYEFKFVTDTEWESGDNRVFYINADGILEKPSDLILTARIEAARTIEVVFSGAIANRADAKVRFVPPLAVARSQWRHAASADARLMGFRASGSMVDFEFHESAYNLDLTPDARVAVAGSFNGWRADGGAGDAWRLRDDDDDNVWRLTCQVPALDGAPSKESILFKFVIEGSQWLPPSMMAANATDDGKGNTNLRLDPSLSSLPALRITTREDIALDQRYIVLAEGVGPGLVLSELTPGRILDQFESDRRLGLHWAPDRRSATLSVFAPRASALEAGLSSVSALYDAEGAVIPPERTVPFRRVGQGVWQAELTDITPGQYYTIRAEGPEAAGEGFLSWQWFADPHARAVAHARQRGILLDPQTQTQWFKGWTDQNFRAPAWEDVLIYEAHVRDLTQHPSSGVASKLRGTYEGILSSAGTGTGLDHLESLGVNMIEFLPMQEFENGTNRHDWGYATAYYFAPEASYARDPENGSQYFELKHLVNELHGRGFGVIMDVVYNHVGSPNIFAMLDKKYYFRQDHNFRLENFSGCGNDVRTEAAMMRRFIVENINYWVEEFHIDGFRFDLAELIDMETLMEIRDTVRRKHPHVMLISEPWSFRGGHKEKLTGTGWAAWNNEFRENVRSFALGHGRFEALKRAVRGSVDTFAANPMQSVNYLESHDDRTLTDELTENAGHDGRHITLRDAARNRIAATVLFTSLGIPMITEGQAYLRSKRGRKNTYNNGDVINALDWTERDRPLARQALDYYRGLSALRASPAGRTFRRAGDVPDDYFDWISPGAPGVFGYRVNVDGRHPGAPFIVLYNTSASQASLSVDFPKGRWRLVGDGVRIDPKGMRPVPGTEEKGRPLRLKVPPFTSLIFMRS